MTTPYKLGKTYVYDLLHDALTARIKGTNRPFTHLVRGRNGQWNLVREDHMGIAYLHEDNDYSVVGSFVILREECSGSDEVPLAFDLSDYRPCKLGVIKMGDKEIPRVTGGGSVFNFIEDWINQTYQWYIDHDIERPIDDLTHAYDVELGSRTVSPEPLEESVVDEGTTSTPETEEAEENPFGALYRRDPVARQKQWIQSVHLEAESPEKSNSFPDIAKSFNEQANRDPIRFDLLVEKELKAYLISLVEGEVNNDEVQMIVRFCRSLDDKYTMIRRTPKGSIIAKANPDENGIIIYFNPNSNLCIADKPTLAYKLKPEFIRLSKIILGF